MTTRFTRLESLVPYAKARAMRGLNDGLSSPANALLIDQCRHVWSFNPEECAVVLFTRDVGHNSSGWWKNPDYERCWHLSVSYQAFATGEPLPQDHQRSRRLAEHFFGDDARLCWIEPPYSTAGHNRDVWHYRLFADEGWQPFKPRGEVYSRDWTPADWKSFSDIHSDAA
jgi:hypothetical protein